VIFNWRNLLIFSREYLVYGRAYATVLRLSVVSHRRLYGMYCG